MILFTTQLTFVSTENTSLLFINFLFNFKWLSFNITDCGIINLINLEYLNIQINQYITNDGIKNLKKLKIN